VHTGGASGGGAPGETVADTRQRCPETSRGKSVASTSHTAACRCVYDELADEDPRGPLLARERCEGPMIAVGVGHGEIAGWIVGLVHKLVNNRRFQGARPGHHYVRIDRHDVQ
jgi:hypothetical protein